MVLILFAFLSLARSRVRELSPSGARAGSHSLLLACVRSHSLCVLTRVRAAQYSYSLKSCVVYEQKI